MPGGVAHIAGPVDIAVRDRDAAGTVRVDSSMRLRILVLGGSSEIGVAIVRRIAQDSQVEALLLGRDYKRMAAVIDELKSTGRATGEFDRLDADEVETHADAIACAFDRLEQVDLVILSVGVLGAQSGLDAEPNEVTKVLRTNFLGCGVAAVAHGASAAQAGPRHRRGALECRRRARARLKRDLWRRESRSRRLSPRTGRRGRRDERPRPRHQARLRRHPDDRWPQARAAQH